MTTDQRQATGDVKAWPVAVLLASASLLVLFDSLAVATALPTIGAEFSLRPGLLQWVVSLYSVSIGAFLILGGRACDLWGRKRMMVASLALCTVAGLIAGIAPNLPVLLAGRALQGVAAAFAIPAALATGASIFREEPWRSRVFSVIAFASWAAGLAGAMMGGLITVHFGWRWVFLVTVPVGVVACLAALVLLPADVVPDGERERLDLWGAVLASTGLVVLIVGLEELGRGTHTGPALLVVCLAVIVLVAFVQVERKVRHPLVKPRLVRSRRMIGSCLAFGAYCVGYTAVIVVLSLRLQEVHGLSAAGAGLALTPLLLGGIPSALLAPMALRRFSARVVVTMSLVSCALALTMIATTPGTTALLPWLVLWGVASGPVYVALTRECISDAEEEDRGAASALLESMSHIGGAIAIAVFMTLLGAGVSYRSTELVGVVVVAAGAVVALTVLPRRREADRR
ncbi:putative MFS family arabinose efflux permease [Lentzea atacamensis]|uniref:Putative MFS family arabinose efflux permease n=1 Tax=Lentzea atacamensis TaxID=531938 RepID=A0A316I373_9PSEU|nr:MFS transporter [Lentzea atacamensis]PWK84883.1 putative MFS family arabinose efflux permease [Lentzea atacamensis]